MALATRLQALRPTRALKKLPRRGVWAAPGPCPLRAASRAEMPREGAWDVCVSSKTGVEYFFHPATKESLWKAHTPPLPAGWGWGRLEGKGARFYVNLHTLARQDAPPTAAAAAPGAPPAPPPPQQPPAAQQRAAAAAAAAAHTVAGAAAVAAAPSDAAAAPYLPYARLNARVLQCAAALDVVGLRAAVEALCASLSAAASSSSPAAAAAAAAAYVPPLGCAPGAHHFPPLEKSHRAVCHEFAEDCGLRSASLGEEGQRSVVVWCAEAGEPPEVRALAAEEAALEAEARARKAAEAAAAAAAAQRNAAAAAAAAAAAGARRAAAGGEEEIAAQPHAPAKLDKRTFEQVKADLGAGGGGGGGAGSKRPREEAEAGRSSGGGGGGGGGRGRGAAGAQPAAAAAAGAEEEAGEDEDEEVEIEHG
jgi:hypothetical protein